MALFRLIAVAIAALFALPAHAYPTKPVRLVVPFPAGGAVDSIARLLSVKLTERLGQPVIVDNRPGAGGNIAADAVAKAPADGYTILITTNGHAISPSLYKSLPFDPVRDFTPVTQLIESPLIIAINPTFPVATLSDLLAQARAKPGHFQYGSTGLGNPLQLSMDLLKQATGTDIPMVTYRGDAPLIQAMISGEVSIGVLPVATARPHVEEKRLRALAITTRKRSQALPDVPTVAEQGVPGFDTSSWQGLFVPARTPNEVVTRLSMEANTSLRTPDVLKQLEVFVAEPVGSTPGEFALRFKSDVAKYAEIIRAANIPLQD
jgi:tripartite-type tricarboxylate transporter receptor subunit TctC